MNIVLYAPAHNCAESNYLDDLTFRLAKQGFSNYIPAIEPLLFISRDKDNILNNEILSYLSLAYDIYVLYEKADCCIGILNGRVPDEGTMVKLGIAYALGVKVLLYKKDCRVLFPTGDNSMILGLSDYPVLTKEYQLIKKLCKLKANQEAKKEFSLLSPSIKHFINLGKDVYNTYNQLDKNKDIGNDLINTFKDNAIINLFINVKEEEKLKECKKQSKVYCSGGLFSPCEQEEMQSIALALEANNYTTFLPQRDGAEPFVLNSINNPFANLPLIKYITKYINKIIFCVDIAEIIRCEHFIVNLNGRAYDEGAMVELGVAFALGKPVALFFNDKRCFLTDAIHPLIKALSFFCAVADSYNKLSMAIEKSENINQYINSDYKLELSENQWKTKNIGDKYIKLLNKLKRPKNNLIK